MTALVDGSEPLTLEHAKTLGQLLPPGDRKRRSNTNSGAMAILNWVRG